MCILFSTVLILLTVCDIFWKASIFDRGKTNTSQYLCVYAGRARSIWNMTQSLKKGKRKEIDLKMRFQWCLWERWGDYHVFITSACANRGHGQCKCKLCEVQGGLLRQHRDQLHEKSGSTDPGDQRKGGELPHFYYFFQCRELKRLYDELLRCKRSMKHELWLWCAFIPMSGGLEPVHRCERSHSSPTLRPRRGHIQHGQFLRQKW